MKIVAGLGSVEDFAGYVQAGADELFCGVMPLEWLEKYGVISPLNRREVLLCPSQIASMSDMRLLARLAGEARIPVAVAFNSTCYAPEQYPLMERLIRTLMDMGFTRFILADPALMLNLRARGCQCQIHLSGEYGEFSRASLDMLAELDITRYIFHRKVGPDEMAACVAAFPGREYEAFVLNERCYYTGAMCHSLHCDELPPLCRVSCVVGGVEGSAQLRERERDAPNPDALGASGCGLCALSTLQRAGITHLKLVGRGNHPGRMERDIRALRAALSRLGDEAAMKRTLFPDGCPKTCYYAL